MLKRKLTEEDIKYKGFPFECSNCGNKPLPKEVISNAGNCAICEESIVAYSVDTAELILKLQELLYTLTITGTPYETPEASIKSS